MRWLVKAARRARLVLFPGALEREMSDELQNHLTELVREGIASGLTPVEAERQARLAFGGVEQTKELARDARGGRSLFDLTADFRYAVRQAVRSPGHALAVIGILAAAVAGAGVSLALARAYLYRPLPFPEADRLVSIIPAPSRAPFANRPNLSTVNWEMPASLFETTGAWDLDGFTIVNPGSAPEYVDGAWVTPGFFELRGLRPAIGRMFTAEEYTPGSTVALISDGLWRSRFGGDPGVVGSAVRLYSTDRPDEDALVTIVGVLPPTSWAQRFSEVLRPLGTPRMFSIARLAAGVSIDEGAARLTSVVRGQVPGADSAWRMSLVSTQDEHVYSIRPVLHMLLLTGVLLLILAQANIGALLVARGTTRIPELAVREALGATRGRLIRQLSVEALVLGGGGLLLGLVLTPSAARATARWLEEFGGVTVPGGIGSVGLDQPVLGGIAVMVVLTFLPLVLWPALRVTGPNGGALTHGRATSGTRTVRLRRVLTTIQVAVAVTLLAQGALLARSVQAMNRTELGFTPERLLKAHLLLPRNTYPDGQSRTQVMERILERLRSTPGVEAATSVFPHPFRGTGFEPVTCQGCTDQLPTYATPQTVTPDYFGAMGIGLHQGRLFQGEDVDGAQPVAVISEALAHRLWPATSALGQSLRVGAEEDGEPWLRVVGVVSEIRKTYSDSLYPDLYRPFAQAPRAYAALLVRTSGDPLSLAPQIRSAVAGENQLLALSDVEPMTAVLADHRGRTSILARFVSGIAALSFGLTLVGLYAVVAYLVRIRRREFAIRAALGATPPQLGREVLGEARGILGIGIALGLAGAVAVAGLLRHQLGGLAPFSFATCVVVAAAVGLAAIAALVLPARSVARLNLSASLREQ